MQSSSRLLMVTREHLADRRYGLGRSITPIQTALEQQGWHVRYLCQHDLTAADLAKRQQYLRYFNHVPLLRHHMGRRLMLGAWAERLQMGWLAAEIAHKEQYRFVHLHDPWLATGFAWAYRRLGLKGVYWGVTQHGFGCYSRATHDDGLIQGPRAQRWLRRLEARTLDAAHWVVAPTQLSLEQLARDLALPSIPHHWHAIPHARPELSVPSRDDARQQLQWDKGAFYILAVGRIVPLKRFDLLVTACAALAARYPQLRLCILGEGHRDHLYAQASAAGFADRLFCLSTEDVSPYLAAADLYISTSATESFGLANLEALVAGTASLCTAVGGVPEVVGAGAQLIHGEQTVLQQAIEGFLQQPTHLAYWQQCAKQHAQQWPDKQQIGAAYAALYQTVAANHSTTT